jgi:hypothetical protein
VTVTMNEIIERISIAIEASRSCWKEDCERCGEIAQIFGSIEAAEKALDALKAGQALADKGERLDWYNGYGRCFDCDVDRDTSSRNTDWRPTPHREGCEWVALLSAFGVTP